MKNNSRLVVIEGLDGSGKSTQFEIIDSIFAQNNIPHKSISFPDYNNPSSSLVKMYLGGEFSQNAEDINAYAASSFYAVDRYASFKLFWEDAYNNGDIILASRYVTSNAIYQMVKCKKNEWDSYLDWLYEYEYEKLGLPKPDLVIFLDMPVEVSQRLMTSRYDGDESKKDIHEVNVEFLKNCREAALYAADRQNWKIINCSDGKAPLSVNTITDKIMEEIKKLS